MDGNPFKLNVVSFSLPQEFELIMVKQQGSLGFTLRKEDDSVLGHYVRALVRKPATDGIIKPGDKIVAVSGENHIPFLSVSISLPREDACVLTASYY